MGAVQPGGSWSWTGKEGCPSRVASSWARRATRGRRACGTAGSSAVMAHLLRRGVSRPAHGNGPQRQEHEIEQMVGARGPPVSPCRRPPRRSRSEEDTSELQSSGLIVYRLLLDKKQSAIYHSGLCLKTYVIQ